MRLTREESAALDRLTADHHAHTQMRPLATTARFFVDEVGTVLRALARLGRDERPSPLTPRQITVLWCLAKHITTRGYAPTYQELGSALGLSVSTVWEYADILCRKGYLLRRGTRKGARDLELTDAGAAWWVSNKEAAA